MTISSPGALNSLALTSPVCVLVEANNENIVGGIPKCLAEMVAVQRFNQQQQAADAAIHGVVTTGIQWRFLKLDGTNASVDTVEYPIQTPRKIFGKNPRRQSRLAAPGKPVGHESAAEL